MTNDRYDVIIRGATVYDGAGGMPAAGANPHPRLYGCFPRVLGRYARDQALLPLREAIGRMTGMPAATFRLPGRGVIRPGAYADLVLFDATVPPSALHQETRAIWDRIAGFWGDYMGPEGDDYQRLLIEPATERLLEIQPGRQVPDIGRGNGSFARRPA